MIEVGINLFSLRTLIGTEEDFLKTALSLKEMGYASIQYSGAEFDPARIKRVSLQSGLPVCLTHQPLDRIINDTDKLMEEHALFGCKTIGLGWIPPKLLTQADEFKKFVEDLARAAEKMQKKGFRLSYHHHHNEFYTIKNGECALEYILRNAPDLCLTLDTYWVHFGGRNVVDFIKRVKERIFCVHLKDYRILPKTKENGDVEMAPKFAPVGDGSLPFQEIISAMRAAGVEHFLVEQDDAYTYPDPMEQVKRSIDYIKENL